MEESIRRRRQHEAPYNAMALPRYPTHDAAAPRRSYPEPSSDRYRPTSLDSSPPTGRGITSTAAYSGYYQEPSAAFATNLSQNGMPYQTEYVHNARQSQNFGAYNPSMMYPDPQANAQGAVYDQSQSFQPRPPAGILIGAEVAPSYFPGESTGSTGAPPNMQTQESSGSNASLYQQSPGDQRAILQSYSTGMASMGGLTQGTTADQAVDDQDYSGSAEMGEAYDQYQTALREIFTNVQRGNLRIASESLLNVSDWLLTKVIELGLASDNQSLHNDRIKLWHDFNHAWLSVLQKQKDLTKADSSAQQDQSRLTVDGLERMGRELIRLCDVIERHGLVDYEYGVWEDRIVEALEDCLDLIEDDNGAADHATSTAHAAL